MKSKTRDNLIYLSVGLGIVALLVADIIYSDAHGRPMWMPSRFAFDVVTGLGLLEYFVILEMRRTKAKPFEAFAAVISAALVHFVIFFAFRREIGELKGFTSQPSMSSRYSWFSSCRFKWPKQPRSCRIVQGEPDFVSDLNGIVFKACSGTYSVAPQHADTR